MKHIRQSVLRRGVALASAALVLVLVLGVSPARAGTCERALSACLIANGLAALTGLISSGGLATILVAHFCLNGYMFCLQYVAQ